MTGPKKCSGLEGACTLPRGHSGDHASGGTARDCTCSAVGAYTVNDGGVTCDRCLGTVAAPNDDQQRKPSDLMQAQGRLFD